MLASGRASYQTARAVNRKVNNANAQKFFDKIKGKPTEKTSGKYAFKAKRGVSEATSKAARQKAQAEASKKLQHMNMRQDRRREHDSNRESKAGAGKAGLQEGGEKGIINKY